MNRTSIFMSLLLAFTFLGTYQANAQYKVWSRVITHTSSTRSYYDSVRYYHSNGRGYTARLDILNDWSGIYGNIGMFYTDAFDNDYDTKEYYNPAVAPTTAFVTYNKSYNSANQLTTTNAYGYGSKTFLYNTSGNLIAWYGAGGKAVDTFIYTGSQLSKEIEHGYYNGSWKKMKQRTFDYNTAGQITQLTDSMWHTDGTLSYARTEQYTYTGSQLQSVKVARWDATLTETTDNYSYNTAGQVDNIVCTIWNNATSSWDNLYKKIYTYNSANQRTECIKQNWNGSAWLNINKATQTYTSTTLTGNIYDWNGSAWVVPSMDTVYKYHYGFPTSANNIAKAELKTMLYPNPANTNTTLSVYTNDNTFAQISVIDITGKEVLKLYNGEIQSGTNNFTIAKEKLSTGTYMVNIKTDTQTETIKLTIL